MIKSFRSKSLLVILCAFFSTPAQSNDLQDALELFALGARGAKNAMETIYLVKEMNAGDVEDFFDNANTLTWDLIVPIIAACYSASVCASKSYNASTNNVSTATAVTKKALAAVVGGGATYVAGTIPKELLKKICRYFVSQKESLQKSIQ